MKTTLLFNTWPVSTKKFKTKLTALSKKTIWYDFYKLDFLGIKMSSVVEQDFNEDFFVDLSFLTYILCIDKPETS